jgi:hypothetical protein
MDLVDRALAEGTRDDVYDAVLVPALGFVRRDRAAGRVGEDEEAAVIRSVREIVDELSEAVAPHESRPLRPCIVGCPAQDQGDVLALAMLRAMVAGRCEVTIINTDLLIAEIAGAVEASGAPLVCVAALPPVGLSRTRYLVKRLRARCPDVRIFVGRWGVELDSAEVEVLRSAGADAVHGSIAATRDALFEALSLSREPAPSHSAA